MQSTIMEQQDQKKRDQQHCQLYHRGRRRIEHHRLHPDNRDNNYQHQCSLANNSSSPSIVTSSSLLLRLSQQFDLHSAADEHHQQHQHLDKTIQLRQQSVMAETITRSTSKLATMLLNRHFNKHFNSNLCSSWFVFTYGQLLLVALSLCSLVAVASIQQVQALQTNTATAAASPSLSTALSTNTNSNLNTNNNVATALGTCGYPGSPAHASVTFSSAQIVSGTAATYTCDNGYELLGPPRRICQSNGTWSPIGIPFCVLNVGLGKAAMQSSTAGTGSAQKAVDGLTSQFFAGNTCTMTDAEASPWWYVNLLEPYLVQIVRIDFGTACCGKQKATIAVRVGNNRPDIGLNTLCNRYTGFIEEGKPLFLPCTRPAPGAFVSIHLESPSGVPLSICETFIFTDHALSIEQCPSFRDQPLGSTATYNGKCYLFHNNQNLNFENARRYCEARGGTLVDETSPALQGFLSWELYRRHRADQLSGQYWLGAIRDQRNGQNWKWISGKDVQISFWNTPATQSNCSRFDGSKGWLWSDTDCNLNLNFICQYRPLSCGKPEKPTNSTLITRNVEIGTVIEYKCAPGNMLMGPNVRTCLASGFFSEFAPKCKYLDCAYPAMIPNGDYKLVNGTTSFQSVVNYACNEGYVLYGRSTLSCDVDERWNGPPPRCEPMLCPAPSPPINGYVTVSSNITIAGTQATFDCRPTYELVGDRLLTCGPAGYWDAAFPYCKERRLPTPVPTSSTTSTTTTTTTTSTTASPSTTTTTSSTSTTRAPSHSAVLFPVVTGGQQHHHFVVPDQSGTPAMHTNTQQQQHSNANNNNNNNNNNNFNDHLMVVNSVNSNRLPNTNANTQRVAQAQNPHNFQSAVHSSNIGPTVPLLVQPQQTTSQQQQQQQQVTVNDEQQRKTSQSTSVSSYVPPSSPHIVSSSSNNNNNLLSATIHTTNTPHATSTTSSTTSTTQQPASFQQTVTNSPTGHFGGNHPLTTTTSLELDRVGASTQKNRLLSQQTISSSSTTTTNSPSSPLLNNRVVPAFGSTQSGSSNIPSQTHHPHSSPPGIIKSQYNPQLNSHHHPGASGHHHASSTHHDNNNNNNINMSSGPANNNHLSSHHHDNQQLHASASNSLPGPQQTINNRLNMASARFSLDGIIAVAIFGGFIFLGAIITIIVIIIKRRKSNRSSIDAQTISTFDSSGEHNGLYRNYQQAWENLRFGSSGNNLGPGKLNGALSGAPGTMTAGSNAAGHHFTTPSTLLHHHHHLNHHHHHSGTESLLHHQHSSNSSNGSPGSASSQTSGSDHHLHHNGSHHHHTGAGGGGKYSYTGGANLGAGPYGGAHHGVNEGFRDSNELTLNADVAALYSRSNDDRSGPVMSSANKRIYSTNSIGRSVGLMSNHHNQSSASTPSSTTQSSRASPPSDHSLDHVPYTSQWSPTALNQNSSSPRSRANRYN